MEDSHVALPTVLPAGCDGEAGWGRIALFGVLDGHGGAEVARFCSRHLPQELLKYPANSGAEVEAALRGSFAKLQNMLESGDYADELTSQRSALYARLLPPGESCGTKGGSTACICAVTETQIITANVGDSRAVLSRGGQSIALSEDHKPENFAEKQRIEAAGGFVSFRSGHWRVNGDLNMSRALGDVEYKDVISSTPDVTIHDRSPEDEFLAIFSDGVNKTNQEVVDFLSERRPVGKDAETAEALVSSCVSGGDNVTLTVVRLDNSWKGLRSRPRRSIT
ncbi:unnamed protein product [Symbiodinium natans]|uniref:PPM-type phosphatase domain-containing protein n=1 Tax=Symbiodinium natans TaxID=878477 RepID=A0A812TFQ7_9DINO|nr:unnamed protein product [Symbiodinium natans]